MTRVITLGGFAAIAAAMMAVQVAALRGRRVAPIGAALRFVKRTGAGRGLLVAAWLWLGWHLFVRVHHA
jgi:hypothetical protein